MTFYYALIGIPIAAAAAGAAIIFKRKQSKINTSIQTKLNLNQNQESILDTETIFNQRPEMREDDKEIVKFISENGGEAFESDLEKNSYNQELQCGEQ